MHHPALFLKKREERRLLAGHVWVFSNEIDIVKSPLKGLAPGQLVNIFRADGKPLGSAYANPNSLICARIFSRKTDVLLDESWFAQRLQRALDLRAALFTAPYYRLCHAEGDGIPGLVLDRYGDYLVGQLNTAGLEAAKPALSAAIEAVLKPSGLLWRNDGSGRAMEGLAETTEVGLGEVPETLQVEENGAVFETAPYTGQKTGWFYDQRLNRTMMRHVVAGKSVLDLFSYTGSWSVQAAQAGARSVTAVDVSDAALTILKRNAQRNNVADRVETMCEDVFDALKRLRENAVQFDVVICDPPAFIKRKKDEHEGLLGYQRVNALSMAVLKPGGALISASCSFHLDRDAFKNTVLKASRDARRQIQIVAQGHQGLDHPIHPAIAETEYLKAFFCRVL